MSSMKTEGSTRKPAATTKADGGGDTAIIGAKSSLGLLYTGYLEKKNPVTGSYKKRFVVLTQTALHWFRRDDGDDLLGEERGQLSLAHILSNRILDEDSTIFEVQGTDGKKRFFRAATNIFCEEWLSAIRSAVKANARSKPSATAAARRASLSMQRHTDHDDDDGGMGEDGAAAGEGAVSVLLVSLLSAAQGHEVVLARNPDWGRLVTLSGVKAGDAAILSLSNGGAVRLSYDTLLAKAEESGNNAEFEVAVQNVPLASSLRLSVQSAGIDLARRFGGSGNGGDSSPASDRNGNGSVNGSGAQRSRRPLGRRISSSLREKLNDIAQVLVSDRSSAVSAVLSLMVLMAALSSCAHVGKEALLLYLFAAALSLHTVYQVVDETRADHPLNTKSGLSLALVIHSHTFTSPDNPVTEVDNDIPQRFIDGCDGDLKEARRRWDITRHWRESEGVNGVLQDPQPYFHLIRAMYPHYFCARGKSGNVVYYERPGDFEGSQIYARGVTLDDLVRHWLFVTEYQWQILCHGDETAKSITVLDIANVKLADVAGTNLEYLKRTVGIANQHYPERSQTILIVNAPYFFSMMWRMVKPLVHENTQKKIRILNSKETLAGMMEYIELENIPEYYGGKLDFGGHDSCRFHCPESLEINEFVRRVNEKHETGGAGAGEGEGEDAPQVDLPPGLPGDLPSSSGRGGGGSGSGSSHSQGAQPAVGTTATSRAMARRASLHAPQRSSAIGGAAARAHKDDDFSVTSATTAGTAGTTSASK